MNPKVIQLLRDSHFVFSREANVLSLSAIAQGGVIDFQCCSPIGRRFHYRECALLMGGAGRARLCGFAGHEGRGYQERGSPVETSRAEQLAVAWVTYDQPELFGTRIATLYQRSNTISFLLEVLPAATMSVQPREYVVPMQRPALPPAGRSDPNRLDIALRWYSDSEAAHLEGAHL